MKGGGTTPRPLAVGTLFLKRKFIMELEKKGFILRWDLVGTGFVVTDKKEVFFLHYTDIKQGANLASIGQPIQFNVAPARPGKRFPRAVDAVVGWADDANTAPAAAAVASTNGGNQQ